MNIRTPLDMGLLIRERRRELGLSQQELADQVRVSRQWIVEVEKGKARAEVGLVLQTLNVLGVALRVGADGEARPEPFPEIPDIDIDAVIDRTRGGGS